jgi:hypothetical protein
MQKYIKHSIGITYIVLLSPFILLGFILNEIVDAIKGGIQLSDYVGNLIARWME